MDVWMSGRGVQLVESYESSKRSTKAHEPEPSTLFRVISWIDLVQPQQSTTPNQSRPMRYKIHLFRFSIRQRHPADRALADAAKVKHPLMFDHIRDLSEALW